MKSIEELESEIKSLDEQSAKLMSKSHKLREELRQRTTANLSHYFGKYIKSVNKNYEYVKYIYVTSVDRNSCDNGNLLCGYGFLYFRNDEGKTTRFETLTPSSYGIEISSDDYTCEYITKEQFYSERERIIGEVLNTQYENIEE